MADMTVRGALERREVRMLDILGKQVDDLFCRYHRDSSGHDKSCDVLSDFWR